MRRRLKVPMCEFPTRHICRWVTLAFESVPTGNYAIKLASSAPDAPPKTNTALSFRQTLPLQRGFRFWSNVSLNAVMQDTTPVSLNTKHPRNRSQLRLLLNNNPPVDPPHDQTFAPQQASKDRS
uniref:Uncharacterized protein n=1 Tax=Fusarium oxysporum (strain Fo5176) TaxID=660025 RepID=A0A0D2YD13_FUSOF